MLWIDGGGVHATLAQHRLLKHVNLAHKLHFTKAFHIVYNDHADPNMTQKYKSNFYRIPEDHQT